MILYIQQIVISKIQFGFAFNKDFLVVKMTDQTPNLLKERVVVLSW